MAYDLTISDDYIDFDYEPNEDELNQALAEITANDWFPEAENNEEMKSIIVKGLKGIIENNDDVKSAIFDMFGVKEYLQNEVFYDKAWDEYRG